MAELKRKAAKERREDITERIMSFVLVLIVIAFIVMFMKLR